MTRMSGNESGPFGLCTMSQRELHKSVGRNTELLARKICEKLLDKTQW